MKTKTNLLLAGMLLAAVGNAVGQPVITCQPQNQTNIVGTTATFTVCATGVEPLSYQWRSYLGSTSFTNIPFADNTTLVLSNVQPTNRRFAVVVTDSGVPSLSVTSSLVTLRVVFLPVITNQPASQAGIRGYPITFKVGASGTSPFAYQWYFNNTGLPGQTADSLTLPPISDLDAGDYFVTVMNPYGAVTSGVARLTVGADIFTKVTEGPGSDVGNSRGAGWGDYDNDGFIDLFVGQIGPGGIGSASHFLYHNNTNGTFSRVTNGPVAAVVSAGGKPAWGDYDNDGSLDLVLVNNNQPNNLFHNNGAESFTEVSSSVSSDILADGRGVTWVDYDNDGYVDIFRATILDEPRRLYHNNHDGTFTRITQGDFLNARAGVFGVAWGDYNNDGKPDLFLPQANEPAGLPSLLYRNDGGGTFTRVGVGTLDGTFNSPAASWGDYDNDGDLDLFVSCAWPQGPVISRPNLFYRNNGDGTFTSLTSLPANDPEYQGGCSMGCKWGDYDNDGWLDLFVANRRGDSGTGPEQNNYLYHNNGDGTFTKAGGIAANDGGVSWSVAWGDYDNDGFLDLFVGNLTNANFLYHNNGNDNHWLKFRLIGTRSNRAAIGAKVRLHATINGQSFWQMREISGGDGISGQNSLHVHVGLGNATNADLVRIEWPSGTVQELPNVAAQQFLTVTEPGGEPRLAATRENGQVQLTLTGKQGSRYAIETSTALPNWNSADLTVTITNQSGAVTFPAPGATNGAHRFYRAVWQ